MFKYNFQICLAKFTRTHTHTHTHTHIYINELLKLKLNSQIFAYADDTALVCSSYSKTSLRLSISNDLEAVSNWLIDYKLLINTSKTKCLVYSEREKTCEDLQHDFTFYCHKHLCKYNCVCEPIEIVSNIKYLGLIIDMWLKWNVYGNYLVNKLRKVNYALFHMREFLASNYLLKLYFSWFEGLLRYGIIHYGGSNENVLKPIRMTQQFAIRNVFSFKKFNRVSHVFFENNILTLNKLYVLCSAIHMHKHIDKYHIRENRVNTRSSDILSVLVPCFRKEITRKQFCYIGPKIINKCVLKLGNDIIFDSRPRFKMKIKMYVAESNENYNIFY